MRHLRVLVRGRGAAKLTGRLLVDASRMLSHRGPDGEGAVGWDAAGELVSMSCLGDRALRVGLGHQRLSIVDLSDAGLQPMRGPDGSWISFNGEIYNYRELRRELEALGHTFHTSTDTEVMLAAYVQWGERCVERFNGMWAFLLYDPARNLLLASRDRLGVKPLYYAQSSQGLIFASEIAPLLRCPGVTATIVPERVAVYLIERRIDDVPATIYRDIHELPGGHLLALDTRSGSRRVERYWHLPAEPDLELGDAEALDRFSELIEDAVRIRLHADVPVAITLSGGIDSSALTVAASRVAGGQVRTFTSRFPGRPRIDETEYADRVARSCGAMATYVEPSTDNVVDDEPALMFPPGAAVPQPLAVCALGHSRTHPPARRAGGHLRPGRGREFPGLRPLLLDGRARGPSRRGRGREHALEWLAARRTLGAADDGRSGVLLAAVGGE